MALGRHVRALRGRFLGHNQVVTKPQVAAVWRSGKLGTRGRARTAVLLVRESLLGPPNRVTVPVAGTRIELGSSGDFHTDWKAFVEVFGHQSYQASYLGARVLDVGAHKGYFGAYALAGGASVVLSFEPEATNYEALARAAEGRGRQWITRNVALGGAVGKSILLRDRTSWAHSLIAVERPAGSQEVEVSTLEEALSALPGGGERTIVKIDAEGSECDILSRPETLKNVDALMVEWHPNAPCTVGELTRVIESAGLVADSDGSGILRFERR